MEYTVSGAWLMVEKRWTVVSPPALLDEMFRTHG